MGERIKRITGSLYWRQFMLTAGMVVLTMALLGVSFYALSYNYTVSEKRQEMQDRAVLVAQLSVDYFTAGDDAERDQGDALRSLAGVASRMTDADGNTLGLVLAVMNSAELMQMWRSFIALFFMTSAIILLLAFVASFVTSMRQIQPLTEMVKATRAYAGGDFDVRMQETGDCGEISELAAAFNAMADSLQETERQRRDFIANVSHELKTPMTTIAGYTDGILDGTIPPEKERQYLQIISDESRRLSRLVRRMLDISQIQNKEMKKEEFDLCESARIALLSMEKKITDRGLDVDAEIPEDSVMVQGDRDLITQVIYNLLENAAKFATPGSQLYLGLAVNGEKAYVTVRNLGSTIPAEEIPLLFERFHKSDKSRSEDKDGYGLGLYIVKTILAQHKEQITVTSQDGVTAFTFTMQMAHGAPREVL